MLIRLGDHSLVNEFCFHFTRSGFTAVPVGGSMVEVGRPGARTPDQGRREVVMHLQMWKLMHPEIEAAAVGG
jgi:hypothetical protein